MVRRIFIFKNIFNFDIYCIILLIQRYAVGMLEVIHLKDQES